MSRSYRKPYGLIDNRSDHHELKRRWNKKVRKSKIIQDGNFFKKLNFDREYEEDFYHILIEEKTPIKKLRRK